MDLLLKKGGFQPRISQIINPVGGKNKAHFLKERKGVGKKEPPPP